MIHTRQRKLAGLFLPPADEGGGTAKAVAEGEKMGGLSPGLAVLTSPLVRGGHGR